MENKETATSAHITVESTSWAKEPNIGYKLINARAETASAKPAFRAAYRDRRCLIPADGFYEWTRRGAAKQSYLIYGRDAGLMAFTGLWERWTVPDGIALKGSLAEFSPGSVIETCAIMHFTTPAERRSMGACRTTTTSP